MRALAPTNRSHHRPGPRDVAAHVLVRIEKDGAFASAALDAELVRTPQLDARDRAFVTELVYGSLRTLPWLRRELARFAHSGIDALDARVRAHLELGAYQICFTRVPPFAAVNEAVAAITAQRGVRLGAFANAILRKLAQRAESLGEDARLAAMLASTPAWMGEALSRALSPSEAHAFLQCGAKPPAVALRVEVAREREAWLERLRAAAPHSAFDPGHISPLCILAGGAGKPQDLPGHAQGAWSVQEEGAQVAALAMGTQEGDVVLDACAGRGNKTAVLMRAVGSAGAVDACDAHPAKLDRLGEELSRLGLRARATHAVDWRIGSGHVSGTYDRVLVDAPCSGVGTLRRRPEIALRPRPPDLVSISRDQLAILSRAAEHLRPGGVLLYVVCSVLREEGEDVVDALLRARPELRPAALGTPPFERLFGDAAAFRLLPHIHGTDGYFMAKFTRVS